MLKFSFSPESSKLEIPDSGLITRRMAKRRPSRTEIPSIDQSRPLSCVFEQIELLTRSHRSAPH